MALTNVMTQLSTMRSLWWAMLILGSGMFAAALYWQYALGEDPCQACIHARLWVVAIALIGALMLLAILFHHVTLQPAFAKLAKESLNLSMF